jgi:hypothetical protein
MDEEKALEMTNEESAGDMEPSEQQIRDDWYGDGLDGRTSIEPDDNGGEPVDDDGDTGVDEKQPDTKAQEANQSFRLKYMGQELDISQDELVTLAQKGKDYDRIRSRTDALSGELRKNSGYLTVLEELAKKSGQSLEDFVGKASRAMGLSIPVMPASPGTTALTQAPGGETGTPRRLSATIQDSPGNIGERSAADRRNREVAEFLAEYGTVDPQTIPKEVWNAVKAGKPLLTAYQSYENKRLKEKIDAQCKNLENRMKTAGSRATAGGQRPRGEIEDDWYNNN